MYDIRSFVFNLTQNIIEQFTIYNNHNKYNYNITTQEKNTYINTKLYLMSNILQNFSDSRWHRTLSAVMFTKLQLQNSCTRLSAITFVYISFALCIFPKAEALCAFYRELTIRRVVLIKKN